MNNFVEIDIYCYISVVKY